MSIKETQDALERAIGQLLILPEHDQPPLLERRATVMEAADAYGAARELKGHVDACGAIIYGRDDRGEHTGEAKSCGDGWLCDVAKAIIGAVKQ